mmetsp:Transcript_31050/g.103427  ORF Transcript_31050/g.103427 Transcript_31050/m.103427 type:complete len:319 (-) Transcript_31050:231-1187(-)
MRGRRTCSSIRRYCPEENMLVNPQVCPAVVPEGARYFESLPATTTRELKGLCTWLNPEVAKDNQACFWWLGHLLDCLMSRICPTVPFSPRNTTVPEIYELSGSAGLLRRVWSIVDEVHWGYFQAMAKAGAFGSFFAEFYGAALQAVQPAAVAEAARLPKVPKLLLLSGHDTGPMLPLYAALELRNTAPYWPEFASMLVLELWNTSRGEVVARWISNSAVVAGPMPFSAFSDQVGALILARAACHTPATGVGGNTPSDEPDPGRMTVELPDVAVVEPPRLALLQPAEAAIWALVASLLALGSVVFFRVWRDKNRSLSLV